MPLASSSTTIPLPSTSSSMSNSGNGLHFDHLDHATPLEPTSSSSTTRPPVLASTTDEMSKFSNESLHSYSFTTGIPDKSFVEGRRSIFYRSIDFMKQKIKGWQAPLSSNVFPVSAGSDGMNVGVYPTDAILQSRFDRGYSLDHGSNGSHAYSNGYNSNTNGHYHLHDSNGNGNGHDRHNNINDPPNNSSATHATPKSKLKRTMTDVPLKMVTNSTSGEVGKERMARPMSISTLSSAANYSALHSPTRFMPQSQAMMTTDQDWNITMANDVASMVFGHHRNDLTEQSMRIFDLVASPYREKLAAFLQSRIQDQQSQNQGQDRGTDESVLLCGKVIRIQKRNSHSAAASLWLKQRRDTVTGQYVYIWVFEEISESVITAVVSSSGEILNTEGPLQALYSYDFMELIGRSITTLIPGLEKLQTVDPDTSFATLDLHQINVIKFFASRSKHGSTFPIICKILNPSEHYDSEPNLFNMDQDHREEYLLRIISMPAIAGVITVHESGIIQSANTVFTKYLFGYPATDLVEKRSLNELIPQFQSILDKLLMHDNGSEDSHMEGSTPPSSTTKLTEQTAARLTDGAVVTATVVRRTAADIEKPSILSANFFVKPTANGSPGSAATKPSTAFRRNFGMSSFLKKGNNNDSFISNSGIVGLHRDGTPLDIDIQIRMIDSPQGPLFAVWITYDREISFSREPNRDPPVVPVTLDHQADHHPDPVVAQLFCSDGKLNGNNKTMDDPTLQDDNQVVPSTDIVPESPLTPTLKEGQGNMFSETGITPRFSQKLTNSSNTSGGTCTPPLLQSPATPNRLSLLDNMKAQYSAVTHLHSIDDFDILESMGQGAYGQVKLCSLKGNNGNNPKVVMKYIVKSRILVDCWINDRVLGMIPMEVHIMHTLRRIPHPNIVAMIDFFEDEENYYVEMTLHGIGMDLFDYIELTPYMTEQEIRGIFRQICEAIHHLHSNNMVHRDIKDENVILDQEGKIQLIDFGSSAYLKEGKKFDTFCGTLDYAAPEVLTGKKYEGRKQDIWALGILLYTLIYKENPFYNIDEILSRDLRIPFVLSEDSIELIRWMLSRDIEKRPFIEEVLAHPWMQAADAPAPAATKVADPSLANDNDMDAAVVPPTSSAP